MKEYDLFIKLLEDEMLNFNALLIKNYKKLGITEKDIIVLSYLARQEMKGYRSFVPSRIKQKVALTLEDLYQSLDNLTTKNYIDIRIETNPKTEKEGEVFYLDNLYNSIVNIYLNDSNKSKKTENFYTQIGDLYEELYHKQMSALDADIVRCWGEERKFSFDEIKAEMLDFAKMGKTSLKSVDQSLIKKRIIKEQSPEYIETNKVIDSLKTKWKK